MHLVSHLVAFGLRQVLGETADRTGEWIERRFCDHGGEVQRALARANDRAWQALAIALAGDGWLGSLKTILVSGDEKGFAAQVRSFLDSQPAVLPEAGVDFRKACLAELLQARKNGLLSVGVADPATLARQAAPLKRYRDPNDLIEAATAAVAGIADALIPQYPNLARLLRQRTVGAPPLLAVAFAFFFQREVQTNAELARGLIFDSLRRLCAEQEAPFAEVGAALDALGEHFDEVLEGVREQLGRIETAARETRSTVDATHEVVLDLQAEMERLGSLQLARAEEVRQLLEEVQRLLGRAGMQRGEVRAPHSFSIRSEDERHAVKALLLRFRELPADEQRQVPALLNGLGKLQVGAGDFAGASQTFQEVGRGMSNPLARAEVSSNAYRAALEQAQWDEALAAIRQAAELDRPRFAPFPLQRYEPRRILGAGGFGTVFLCRDRYLQADVVIKALHADELERSLSTVFAEARALRMLRHPAIIEVLDCSYADLDTPARPYIVMDYFAGQSLNAVVRRQGPLPLADVLSIAGRIVEAMQAAHARGILHRDLKPDNVLVQQEDGRWLVKVIDFGLALGRHAVQTSKVRCAEEETILGASVAGTFRYAPPEQLGELFDSQGRRAPVGPYSDVYAFGKLCCYALFRTTEPRSRHLATLPALLRDLLERCLEQELEHRHPSFAPIQTVLNELEPRPHPATADRPREGTGPRHSDGEAELIRFFREALERSGGCPNEVDRSVLVELCRRYGINQERARGLLKPIRDTWRQERRAEREIPAGKIVTGALGLHFVWCPPGIFLMGSPPDEEGRGDDESPDHWVTLTHGFWMGVTPVTQLQWQRVMGNNPSRFDACDLPVESVTWEDCQEFCKRLTRSDGRRYRLPTEAEWEYACRAGTSRAFCFGATLSTDQANFDGTYSYARSKKGIYRARTTPVGTFPGNAWGLFDMHGNVWEWCHDWYAADYYSHSPETGPRGPQRGDARVLRGGSWFDPPQRCRSAFRFWAAPSKSYVYAGFRIIFCPS